VLLRIGRDWMREVVCVCLGVVALQPTRANHSIQTEYELEGTSVNKKYEFLRQGNRLPIVSEYSRESRG
jgi:hypothetical protein